MKRTPETRKKFVKSLARGGIIAAMYAALTFACAPIAFGPMQLRVSEALCVLPFFFPEAIPGLFVGCIIANLISPNIVVLDVIFGSLATLGAAFVTSKIKNKFLAPLPPVLFNAVVVGFICTYSEVKLSAPGFVTTLLYNMLSVGAGEAIVCFALGIPLTLVLQKLKDKHFPIF